jgi:hypothetical protein
MITHFQFYIAWHFIVDALQICSVCGIVSLLSYLVLYFHKFILSDALQICSVCGIVSLLSYLVLYFHKFILSLNVWKRKGYKDFPLRVFESDHTLGQQFPRSIYKSYSSHKIY